MGFTAMHPDETKPRAVHSLRNAPADCSAMSVKIRHPPTENRPHAYMSSRVRPSLGLRHAFILACLPSRTPRQIRSCSRPCANGPTAGAPTTRPGTPRHPPSDKINYSWNRPHAAIRAETRMSRPPICKKPPLQRSKAVPEPFVGEADPRGGNQIRLLRGRKVFDEFGRARPIQSGARAHPHSITRFGSSSRANRLLRFRRRDT